MTRRDLVRASCASLAALFLRGASASAATSATREQNGPQRDLPAMKLGLVTYNLAAGWDLPMVINRCRQTGYQGVELRTTHAHGVEPDISVTRRKEVRQMFAESGLTLWGLGTACEFHRDNPALLRENIELTKRFCELARDVGGRGVKVRPNGLVEGVAEDRTLKQIANALKECGDAGGDNGVEIWVEMHGAQTQEPRRMRRIMDLTAHPNVGVTWNSNPVDVTDGSVRDSFLLMKDFIRSVHINELTSGYPWRELFSLLKGVGYNRFTLQEIQGIESCSSEQDILRFMRYYRSLWEELSRSSASIEK